MPQDPLLRYRPSLESEQVQKRVVQMGYNFICYLHMNSSGLAGELCCPKSPTFIAGTKMLILVVAIPSFQVRVSNIACKDRPVSCIYHFFSPVLFPKLIHLATM